MDSRRFHVSNAGRRTGLVALGLEGPSIYVAALSVLLSIATFLFLFGNLQFTFISALIIALIPFLGFLFVTLTIVRNKPSHFLEDFLEWSLLRLRIHFRVPGSLFRASNPQTISKRHD
ncbi:MAG: hypothetical protein AAF558_02980 [Verrucomicrobiota bacterium]